MANPKRVAHAAKEDRRVVDPGATLGDVAERKRATVVERVLHQDCLLLALAGNCRLVSTKNFIGVGDGKLCDRDVGALGVLDDNGRAMGAVAEEGGAE